AADNRCSFSQTTIFINLDVLDCEVLGIKHSFSPFINKRKSPAESGRKTAKTGDRRSYPITMLFHILSASLYRP
ncbi:MAG: hypothetical protein J6P94_00495, partial [Oscillospiraceae bacterium]|nr:hypothetical protein [Oscillospiraceae bacterium]